jgi:hypothetical protein
MWELNLVAENQSEIADAQLVSGGFYAGLGVPPAAGRLIGDDDDRSGAAPVAVLSYRYWQNRFAANPAAIGRAILINNTPFTIVGVSAPGFFGVNPETDPKIYLPLHAGPLLAANPADEQKRRFIDSNSYWLEMMGRLRPGVSTSQAETWRGSHQFRRARHPLKRRKRICRRCGCEERAALTTRRRYSKPLYVPGDGRPDSHHRVRQYRQSSAGAFHGTAA